MDHEHRHTVLSGFGIGATAALGVGMMVALILGGMVAGLLLMRRVVGISGVTLVGEPQPHQDRRQLPGVVRYDVAGPLFFGAAQRAFEAITLVDRDIHTVIIDLSGVAATTIARGHL